MTEQGKPSEVGQRISDLIQEMAEREHNALPDDRKDGIELLRELNTKLAAIGTPSTPHGDDLCRQGDHFIVDGKCTACFEEFPQGNEAGEPERTQWYEKDGTQGSSPDAVEWFDMRRGECRDAKAVDHSEQSLRVLYNEAQKYKREVTALSMRIAELELAGSALLKKLDQVAKDTEHLFVMDHIHGGKYTGANWVEEYRALESAIGTPSKGEAKAK